MGCRRLYFPLFYAPLHKIGIAEAYFGQEYEGAADSLTEEKLSGS